MKQKGQKLRKLLKFTVVGVCLTGFLLQTFEFLELYWTYPTVVDIQVAVPSEIELPAISFCSTNGIRPSVICQQLEFCIDSETFQAGDFCSVFSEVCTKSGQVRDEFKVVTYDKYVKHTNFNSSMMARLMQPFEEFLTCKIKSAGRTRNCDLSNMMVGSYFSDTNLFNFCYTLNSVWGNPDRKSKSKQIIKKSERIEMEFYINLSDAPKGIDYEALLYPKYNYPSNPGVQLAIHSPYIALSPFVIGTGFLAGKLYQIKLEQDEKHLLPAPYQTNCTDYMKMWLARGGIGPLNQMMVVEECKYNKSLAERGCVPFSVDYPHNNTVCGYCKECGDLNAIRDECTKQLNDYNQPCDFIQFHMQIEEKLVYVEKKFASTHLNINETIVQKRKGTSGSCISHNEKFDCSAEKIWTKPCQIVSIELVFDNFQITNLTYNPKFESIELFSVIGGYMGMYLGVSIVAVYDFAEIIATTVFHFLKKRQARIKKEKSEKKRAMKMARDKFRRSVVYTPTFNRFH